MRWEPKKSILLVFILALILAANAPHAAACTAVGNVCGTASDCCSLNCQSNRCEPAKPWHDGIYVWVGLAVLISAAFIGLAYMAAQLFRISIVDAWVKIEMQELAAGIIIAVFCIALVASVNASAAFLIGAQPGGVAVTNIGELATTSLSTVYADGAWLYKQLGDAYFNIAKIASYSYTAGISAWYVSTSVSSTPAQGLYPLASEVGGAMDSVSSFMLFIAAQQSFIIFFINASQIMLPVGIFLRCFSLSRKVGGVVLASVIASSVIYPAAFAVSNEVYKGFSADLRNDISNIHVRDPGNPPLTNLVCSPWMQRFIESPLALVTALATSGLGAGGGLLTELVSILLGGEFGWQITVCIPLCSALGPAAPNCMVHCFDIVEKTYVGIKSGFPVAMYPFLASYSPSLSGQDINDWYFQNMRDIALPAAAKFAVLVLVFSLIPLIITMTLLRSLAITFGGEPQLYGISKLV